MIYDKIMPKKFSSLNKSDVVLIESIKCTPALYDRKHSEYYSLDKKRDYWLNIAKTLNISECEVCRRWNCLRKRYVRDLRQLLHHPYRMDICNTEFFKRMDFLKTFIRKRPEHCKYKLPEYIDVTAKSDTMDIIDKPKPFIHFENDAAAAATTTIIEDVNPSNGNQTNSKYFGMHCEAPADLNDIENTCYNNDNNKSFLLKNNENDSVYDKDISTAHNFYLEFFESIKQMENGPLFSDSNTPNSCSKNTHQKDCDMNMNNSVTTANLLNNPTVATNQLQSVEGLTLGVAQNAANTNSTAKVYLAIPQINESDECFAKTIASYLKRLPLRHKIKAEIDIMQILKTYIEMEDMQK